MSKETKAMFGTFARVFLYVMIAFVLEHKSIIGIDWLKAVDAAVIGTLAVGIGYLNPSDTRYGRGAKHQDNG